MTPVPIISVEKSIKNLVDGMNPDGIESIQYD
jgi:hypothetical protein